VYNIGLEQELFFVPRDKYYSRQDLQFTGRTLGKMCARGQEGCGHYMGPIMMNGPVLKCMQDIQFECYTCAGGRAFEPPARQ
jgi:glutamine synthetase